MPWQVRTISLKMPLRVGGVNCYLVESQGGYALVDSGMSNHRAEVEKAVADAGCEPGKLKLIILTHADSDHSGNSAYLRSKFGAKIVMHPAEVKVAETGYMILSRKHGTILAKFLLSLFRPSPSDRFSPDLLVDDGYDLTSDGLDACVVHIPGHSAGSIGVLTSGGDLFCGDLLTNTGKPMLNSLIDDKAAASASVEKIKGLHVRTVYPGHGSPFSLEHLVKTLGDKR